MVGGGTPVPDTEQALLAEVYNWYTLWVSAQVQEARGTVYRNKNGRALYYGYGYCNKTKLFLYSWVRTVQSHGGATD